MNINDNSHAGHVQHSLKTFRARLSPVRRGGSREEGQKARWQAGKRAGGTDQRRMANGECDSK